MTRHPLGKKPETGEDIFDLPLPAEEVVSDPIKKGRICQTCGKNARIVSNGQGVFGFCGPCKTDWMISGPRIPPSAYAASLPRGISKVCLIPQDTEIAFEEDEGDMSYETRRQWKERK